MESEDTASQSFVESIMAVEYLIVGVGLILLSLLPGTGVSAVFLAFGIVILIAGEMNRNTERIIAVLQQQNAQESS